MKKSKRSKFLLATLLGLSCLTGCSQSQTNSTKSFLNVACDAIETYGKANDRSKRMYAMDEASANFRKAALESSDLKFEIFAEYSRVDTPYFQVISEFCKTQ